MGAARHREMQDVKTTLELADMRILDLPDGKLHKALDCYVTYADVIAATKIHEVFGKDVHFEIFREDHKPPLKDLFDGLQDTPF